MNEKLLARLDDLAEVIAAVRAKSAGQLDGLAVARLLIAVDAAACKLAKLSDELQPPLPRPEKGS